MKLPRNVDARQLIKAFERVGYTVERQRGSPITMIHRAHGTHEIVVPNHKPIGVGTLNRLLGDTAKFHGMSRDEWIERLGL